MIHEVACPRDSLPGLLQGNLVSVEHERDRRTLFIGNLSKNNDVEHVRDLLSPYGTVEECKVLHDNFSNRKSCAFATMRSREECWSAIRAPYPRTMEGASTPVVIKFADPLSERAERRSLNMYCKMLARQVALWQGNLSEANVDGNVRVSCGPVVDKRKRERFVIVIAIIMYYGIRLSCVGPGRH
eukprot:scpid95203/ scgid5818/ CUGBP Elav-like family member 6; Bruno-like protein 6; CUG-BP- and ETR-3-like factor 6; RNA-binding protein BRUNOL-6